VLLIECCVIDAANQSALQQIEEVMATNYCPVCPQRINHLIDIFLFVLSL